MNRIITGQKSDVCFPKIAFHAIKSPFSLYIYIYIYKIIIIRKDF